MMDNPQSTVASVMATFTQLAEELTAAQQRPLDPGLRAELSRLATASQQSAAQLATAQQQATAQLAAKKQQAAALAAANKQAIAEKKKSLAAKKRATARAKEDQPQAIDPTLGKRRGEELLKRQQRPIVSLVDDAVAKGLFDGWDQPNATISQPQ